MPFALTPRRLRPSLALAAALLLWTGCDSSEPNFVTPDPPGFGENENVVPAFDRDGDEVGQVSLTRLFAEPTQQELDNALAAVSGRDHGVYDYQLVGSAPTPYGTLHVVSHTVRAEASAPTHYGAIHVPNGADGQPASNLPVLVYNHGGDSGVNPIEAFAVLGLFDPETEQFVPDPDPGAVAFASGVVVVIPSFRSEELETLGLGLPQNSYTSTGSPSPWDYDVDDAITLTNVALQEFDEATDESRIGTLGLSRGGAVSLLMAVRDSRVKVVTDFFGPTDFLEDRFQLLATTLLAGPNQPPSFPTYNQALSLPGADFILDALLLPLSQAGPNQTAYTRARQAILFRSAAYYTELMPSLQVHHHYRDAVVNWEQSRNLNLQREAEPNMGAYDFNLYGEPPTSIADLSPVFHNPAAFRESIPATIQFHFENLIGN